MGPVWLPPWSNLGAIFEAIFGAPFVHILNNEHDWYSEFVTQNKAILNMFSTFFAHAYPHTYILVAAWAAMFTLVSVVRAAVCSVSA